MKKVTLEDGTVYYCTPWGLLEENKTNMTDKIVELVKQDLDRRSQKGIKTYNTTLWDNNEDDFLQHLYEELLDATNYIKKILVKRNGL